jgi:hypothetical protein
MATLSLSPHQITQRLLKHRSAVATLARQAAIKAVKHRLRADGLKLHDFSAKDIDRGRLTCDNSLVHANAANEQDGLRSFRLLFTLTCCAMPADTNSPMMDTIPVSLRTISGIAICNQRHVILR